MPGMVDALAYPRPYVRTAANLGTNPAPHRGNRAAGIRSLAGARILDANLGEGPFRPVGSMA